MMEPSDVYPWAKGLHVAAALIFASGVLMSAVLLSALSGDNAGPPSGLVARVRRWDLLVTTPAMVATWALGLFLGIEGSWFTSNWLIAKLVFVIGLSGLHGILSARLRLAVSGRPVPRANWSAVVIAFIAAIAILATTKI